jgi:hypothetical protein
MSRSAWGVTASVLVAAVFVVASITKLAAPAAWRAQAAAMKVPRRVAAAVPYGEALLGALLAAQVQRHLLAWLAVAVLVAFSGLVALHLAHGRHPVCACFGSFSAKPIGAQTMARNAVFVAIGVLAAVL